MHDAARSQSNCGELVYLSQGLYAKNLLSTFVYPADSFLVAYPTILPDYQVLQIYVFIFHSMAELWPPNLFTRSNFFTFLFWYYYIFNLVLNYIIQKLKSYNLYYINISSYHDLKLYFDTI